MNLLGSLKQEQIRLVDGFSILGLQLHLLSNEASEEIDELRVTHQNAESRYASQTR